MATKFNSMNEAIAAAKAHNKKIMGEKYCEETGYVGRGYQLSETRSIYDGFEYLPGYWTVFAKKSPHSHACVAI